MIPYFGDFAEDDTIDIPFNTFTSDDPSASSTITNFINTDVHIHKDGGLTQRNNAAGITVSVDFDGITGNHLVKIDTSDDTVAAFWVTGSEYQVRIEGTTVDGATLNVWIGAFSIERAGGTIALLKLIQAAVITNAAGTDIAADIIAVKAETVLIVADTNELQADDIPGKIATAQSDLDTITGASGVIVADGLLTAAKFGADFLTNAKIADNAFAVEQFKDDCITAAKIATDAIDANALKTDAVTEIVDAVWAKAMVDIATGAPSATTSVLLAINYIYEAWRNVVTTTATLVTVMKDDGTTALVKSTISDDETTFTKGEMVSGT